MQQKQALALDLLFIYFHFITTTTTNSAQKYIKVETSFAMQLSKNK